MTHLAIWTDSYSHVTHHVVAMEKVAKQYILPKCSNCDTFQVISGLVHDFMNLMSQLFQKFIKNN